MSMRSTDYALLAKESYQDPVLQREFVRDGVTYKAIDTFNDRRTGFQATAYQRTDTREIVVAYRGTEFDREPIQDGFVDAGMVLNGINAQEAEAAAFTKRVLELAANESKHSGRPIDVTVTGHSLGGTLAEINAAKFGLRGETFNAYGAGSLFGVPSGGSHVIDHVRAGDMVSAASAHFGEVRIYAAQQDIDRLSKAGYRDDSGILSPRNPIKATDFGAHAIDNFVPNSKLLGQSIINPESQARYRAHEGMVDRYRSDVMHIRKGLSATWEVPKEIDERAHALGREVAQDMTKAGRAIGHAAHEVADAAKRAGHEVARDVSDAAHAIGDRVSSAWNTVSHPGSWFGGGNTVPRLDDKSHPDHALFQQARDGVHRLDARHQHTPDERSDRLAASLAVAARQAGMQRIDQVEVSKDAARAYAVQGNANSPHKQVVEVDTQKAMSTSIEDSSRTWQEVAQRGQVLADREQQHGHHQPSGRSTPGAGP